VEPAAGSLGAYVYDFDVSRPLDHGQQEQLRSLILEHHVVCLRGQDISPAQQVEFTRSLGEFYYHPVVNGLEGHPEIVEVFGAHKNTEAWHQDASHSECPPRFSVLVPRKIPPFGNDTQFSNQHKAYDAISDGLKAMLAGVRAIHTTGEPTKRALERASVYGIVSEEASHPVVRTHPDTGRKALFVNAMYTRRFDGMTAEESRGLLEFLYAHCGRSDFTFRHRWQLGDVLIWDNASVQHAVVGDMPEGTERYLHRTTTVGEVPL
jgi:taurine dioxygenase